MNKLHRETKKYAEALLHAARTEQPPVLFDPIIAWIKDNLKFELTIIPGNDFLSRRGLSGKMIIRNKHVFILVNNNDPITRQRFTIAHEIGHLIENLQVAYMSQTIPTGYDKERFADTFAAELLMPADLIRNEWTKLSNTTEPTIIQYRLARKFNVSNEAMGYRLNELNLQSEHWAKTKIPPAYR